MGGGENFLKKSLAATQKYYKKILKKNKKQKTRWVWGKNKVPIFFEIKGNFFRKRARRK